MAGLRVGVDLRLPKKRASKAKSNSESKAPAPIFQAKGELSMLIKSSLCSPSTNGEAAGVGCASGAGGVGVSGCGSTD